MVGQSVFARTATKKSAGTIVNKADSAGRRLGVKILGGQQAETGHIIIRQRGKTWHPGMNVFMGKDHTLHAGISGKVV